MHEQNEVCKEKFHNLEKKVDKVEQKVEKLDGQNNTQNEILVHVRTAVEFMVADCERREKREEEQIKVMQEISKTQIAMRSDIEVLNSDVDEIKKKQEVQENKSKIDVIQILRDNASKLISGAIWGALIMGAGYFLAHL